MISQPFDYNINRDAWATIRGFLYQIQVTIVRWLDLDKSAALVCECGEDIDHVVNAFAPEEFSETRLLEQVKLREQSISLASAEVKEVISNFLEHREKNPNLELYLRFTTNTTPAKERGHQFPRNLTGIEAWHAIRDRTYDSLETEQALQIIRTILQYQDIQLKDNDRPHRLNAFLQTSNDTKFFDVLVSRIEWSCCNGGIADIENEITSKLITLGFAVNTIQAKGYIAKLIAFVIHKLSHPGYKVLTAEELTKVLSAPIPPVLSELVKEVGQISSKTEAMFGRISDQLATIQEVQERGFSALGKLTEMPIVPNPPALDSPPLVPPLFAKRPTVINSLEESAKSTWWLALCGSKGTGKTQLARALLETSTHYNKAWLSLAYNQDKDPRAYVEQRVVGWISQVSHRPDIWQRYAAGLATARDVIEAVSNVLPTCALVVDDIPELSGLNELLVVIGRFLGENGGLLLTTSNYKLPNDVKQYLQCNVSEVEVPYFDETEVRDFLFAAGLPAQHPAQALAKAVVASTGGHPQLVAAHVSWLRQKDWPTDIKTFSDITQRVPSQEVHQSAVRRAFQLVKDDMSRSLLARLSLVIGSFEPWLVHKIAALVPPVSSPIARLEELVGPWVDRLPDDHYRVVQLLYNAGNDHLPESERINVHKAIVSALRKRVIGINEINAIIGHMAAAGMLPKLVNFICYVLFEVSTSEQARRLSWLSWLFPESTDWLAENIDFDKLVTLRAVQLRTRYASGEDVSKLKLTFDQMVNHYPPESASAVFGALMMVSILDHNLLPRMESIRYAFKAIRMTNDLPDSILDESPVPVDTAILFYATNLETVEQIAEYIDLLVDMGPEYISSVLMDCLTPHGVQILADRVWIVESRKPHSERNWQYAMSVLDKIGKINDIGGWFTICAIRAKSVILADHLDDVSAARELLANTVTSTSDQSFLIEFTKASNFLDENELVAAYKSYQTALQHEGEQFQDLRFEAIRRLAEVAARMKRWNDAITAGLNAYRFRTDYVREIDRLEMLGEVAWYQWISGNKHGAYSTMHTLAIKLAQIPDKSDARFRELFIKAGHLRGWLVSDASGRPLQPSFKGEEAYATPYVGLFSRRNPKLAEIDVPISNGIVFLQQGYLALELGLLNRASISFTTAERYLLQEDNEMVVAASRAPFLALKQDFSTAFDLAMQGSIFLASIRKSRESESSVFDATIDPETIWAETQENDRRSMERFALFNSFLGPAFVGLIDLHKSNDEIRLVIEGLRTEYQRHNKNIQDPQYWEQLLDLMALTFTPGSERQLMDAATPEDSNIHTLSYLGYASRPRTPLADVAAIHAIMIIYYARMPESFTYILAKYITGYWRQVSRNEGFRLSSPKLLREAVEKATSGLILQDVATILLAAEGATRSIYKQEVRQALLAIKNRQSGSLT